MQSFSPYQFNPLNINPLQTLLEAHVDFEALRADEAPRLFLSATDVRTGRLRLFSNGEVTARSVMASACLPQLFHAVELDGVPYWDGAYVANPALLPLIADSAPQDLLIIQLNPATRNARPRTASAVAARLNEITFNASLMQELRGLALLKRALDEENSVNELRTPLFHQVRTLKLHRIAADESQVELSAHRAADAEWAYLIRMHRIGAAAADAWLRQHGGKLGKTSSLKYGELA
jgi:NTE family protein